MAGPLQEPLPRWHRRRHGSFLAVLAVLTAAALAALAVDPWLAVAGDGPSAAFQRLAGGLGAGPATDLARCGFSFDPRLLPSCPHWLGPLPGGGWFCRCHPRVGWEPSSLAPVADPPAGQEAPHAPPP
jgi:hypothetical protein